MFPVSVAVGLAVVAFSCWYLVQAPQIPMTPTNVGSFILTTEKSSSQGAVKMEAATSAVATMTGPMKPGDLKEVLGTKKELLVFPIWSVQAENPGSIPLTETAEALNLQFDLCDVSGWGGGGIRECGVTACS